MRARLRRRAAGLGLAAAMVAGGSLPAQEQTLSLAAYDEQPKAQQVVLECTPVLASHGRAGPVGWVTCQVSNPDGREHTIDLAVTTWAERNQVVDRLRLAPGERAVRHYPAFRTRQFPLIVARCDGGPEARSNALGAAKAQVCVLVLTPQADAASQLEADFQRRSVLVDAPEPGRRPSRGSRASKLDVVDARSADLPDTWTCFAGFDAVVVDGRGTPGLAAQQALLDLVAAGGRVFVTGWRGMSQGPLSTACAAAAPAPGFGRLVATDGALPDLLDRAQGQALVDTCVAAAARSNSGPAGDGLYAHLIIPGLGRAPVGAFFVLLTVFVLLAGPVNWLLCRRARRPLLLVVTLPLLGFGFAGAILLWGILAEGLGVRGAVRSVTWLDQRQHVGASQAGMALFAGLTPDALTPSAGTLVYSDAVADDWGARTPHRYRLDVGAGGRIDGALLPARYETQVVTASCCRVRERLRFRRLADGSLEALCGPGLLPVAPGVLVRDHRGHLWCGEPSGERTVLQPCDEAAAATFLTAASVRIAAQDLFAPEARFARRPADQQVAVDLPDTVANGSYVAWVSDNAAFDKLGLQVAWEDVRHLVFGLLAEEDFVD